MAGEFENLIMRDTRANQPAAGIPGRLYYVTDENVTERDNGATWDDCSDGGGTGIVDDTAYDATTWNGDTTHAPSKNAVRDKIESMSGGGGRTLITSATPSGTGTVSFTSIPGTYTHLEIEYVARSTRAGQTNDPMKFNINSDTTDANYRRVQHFGYATNTAAADGADDRYLTNIPAASSPSNSASSGIVRIPFYAGTTFNKQIIAQIAERRDSGATINELVMSYGREWENTAAITQLDLILDNGNFVAGSTFNLYGVD